MSAPELKRGKNGYWYIHWTDGRRSKRVSTRQKDLAPAKTFLGEWLLMESQPPAANGTDAGMPCETAWEAYVTGHVERKNIDAHRRVSMWQNLGLHFAGKPVAAVTQADIDAYVRKRTSGALGRRVQVSTVWLELCTIKSSWRWCARKRLLSVDAIPDVDLPSPPEPRDRWLRTEEVDRLFAVLKASRVDGVLSPLELFTWLALHTAGRRRAILDLTWGQVDFDIGVIHYNQTGRTQTKKRRPSVPISKSLMPILRTAHKQAGRPSPTKRVVLLDGEVNRLLERAGLAADVPGVTPHVLRHTAATHMVRNGASLWQAAKILGNSVTMIEKVYAKHSPEDLRQAVDSLGDVGATLGAAPNLGVENDLQRPTLPRSDL